jgi:3-dehydroquinate synthase
LPDTFNTIEIHSSMHTYEVKIGSRFADYILPNNSIILADVMFTDLLKELKNPVVFVESLEENKSLETCIDVLERLNTLGANKSTTLVALGGGIIQDIATLVSSLYMRGIRWIYFPTTKMSQLDSCIGGKSSINLRGKKNLVGNIYPPTSIHHDFTFDLTLSKPALASGYLEAIKISFAHSEDGFLQHLKLTQNYEHILEIQSFELTELVISQKKLFIEQDEFDLGIRQLLNFGHTFGHALESASSYSIQHGLAIGLGMIMAINHPLSQESDRTRRLEIAIWNILRFAGSESVSSILSIKEDDFISAFLSDKKHKDGNFSIIVPSADLLSKETHPWNIARSQEIIDLLNHVRADLLNEVQ